MQSEEEYRERVAQIVTEDSRYAVAAYDFVRAAVSFTGKKLERGAGPGKRRHISGQELLEGIREMALNEFGPLTLDVLEEWGLKRAADFGNIVFNLVNHNLLGASEEDSPDDFADGYDFTEAFLKPFVEVGELPSDLPKIA